MAKASPVKFFRQVKQEVSKVTWSTRKEVTVTSIMVLVLGALAATFFFVVDYSISSLLQKILVGIGG